MVLNTEVVTQRCSVKKVFRNFGKFTGKQLYSGCEITVGYRTCPTNLAQRRSEKRFLLLNTWAISDENLFFVKP